MLSSQSLMNNVCLSQLNPKAEPKSIHYLSQGKGPVSKHMPRLPESQQCAQSPRQLSHVSQQPPPPLTRPLSDGMGLSPHWVLGRILAGILPRVSPPGQN